MQCVVDLCVYLSSVCMSVGLFKALRIIERSQCNSLLGHSDVVSLSKKLYAHWHQLGKNTPLNSVEVAMKLCRPQASSPTSGGFIFIVLKCLIGAHSTGNKSCETFYITHL